MPDAPIPDTPSLSHRSLSFGNAELCSVASMPVVLFNNASCDLLVASCTSDNINFEAAPDMASKDGSPSDQVLIPPFGQQTYLVYLLPRELGPLSANLIFSVLSSCGDHLLSLSVDANAESSSFYLDPLTLAHRAIPAGFSYSLPLAIYNPLDEYLEVQEIFTDGDFLHLLPAPDTRRWLVPPYTSHLLTHLLMHSEEPLPQSGFVNILTSHDTLVAPVSVNFFDPDASQSHFVLPSLIDFGTISLESPTSVRSISVFALQHPSRIVGLRNAHPSVSVETVFSSPLHLQPLSQASAPASSRAEVLLTLSAHVLLRSMAEEYPRQTAYTLSSHLVLESSLSSGNTHKLTIPYRARLLLGSLEWSPSNTTFHIASSPLPLSTMPYPSETEGASEAAPDLPLNASARHWQAFRNQAFSSAPEIKPFVLTNSYDVSVRVFTAQLSHPLFEIVRFSSVLIRPRTSVELLQVRFIANHSLASYSADLILQTDLGALSIPYACFHGKLSPSTSAIDFGEIRSEQKVQKSVTLFNPNLIPIEIQSFSSSFSLLHLSIDALDPTAPDGRLKLFLTNSTPPPPLSVPAQGSLEIFISPSILMDAKQTGTLDHQQRLPGHPRAALLPLQLGRPQVLALLHPVPLGLCWAGQPQVPERQVQLQPHHPHHRGPLLGPSGLPGQPPLGPPPPQAHRSRPRPVRPCQGAPRVQLHAARCQLPVPGRADLPSRSEGGAAPQLAVGSPASQLRDQRPHHHRD